MTRRELEQTIAMLEVNIAAAAPEHRAELETKLDKFRLRLALKPERVRKPRPVPVGAEVRILSEFFRGHWGFVKDFEYVGGKRRYTVGGGSLGDNINPVFDRDEIRPVRRRADAMPESLRYVRVDVVIECYEVTPETRRELLDAMPEAYGGEAPGEDAWPEPDARRDDKYRVSKIWAKLSPTAKADIRKAAAH